MRKVTYCLIITLAFLHINVIGQSNSSTKMVHTLKPLPYELNALEPKMSQRTLEFHWGKHLATYVLNINKLIDGTEYADKSLEYIVLNAPQGPIFNNAAQVINHDMFFEQLSPKPKTAPTGKLLAQIDKDFGSVDKLVEELSKSSLAVFGSGWTWLVVDKDSKLKIVNTANAGNPMTDKLKPILCVDVWEHGYYLDYQNRRADFVKNVFELLDWGVVEKRF